MINDGVTSEPDEQASGTDKEALIKEAKDYLQLCITVDGGNRAEALDDLRFETGDQWPDEIKRARQIDKRPCLTINKLPTFLHQVTNDQRQNVPSIKVSPVDSKADIKTAEVIQGIVRHIEYSSNADVCYDTAVNSAAAIGFGYFRLITDYCDASSWDQDIKFKRIRNAFTVYFDPLSEEPDGSDQQRCMISSKMDRQAFKRDYPDAEASDETFMTGIGDPSNLEWIGKDFVRIAEYYRFEYEHDELVELSNGETGLKSQLLAMPEGVTIKRSRPTQVPKIMLYKITALDILESTEIKCKWIPVFPVYGDEVDIDGTVVRSGLIRNAKDPARMYNFWMTSATEEVALRPKTPYIGAEGQFEGYEDDWGAANVKSFPYLEYKQVALDGQQAPPPARQPMADIPNGLLTMAMHANDNIKATTGLFDSSLGALGNARSGVQERSQQRQGDMANFHFTDNLNRTVRHVGRCIISMIPHYMDAPRIVRVMGEDDTIKPVPVNQPYVPKAPGVTGQAQQQPGAMPQPGASPQLAGPTPDAQVPGGPMPGAPMPPPGATPPAPDPQAQAVQTVMHDLTVGEYDVTVKAGPSYSTLREEAADAMIQFGKAWPKLMDVAGDKVIAAMDWPGATEIAERVAKTIPPELREGEDTDSPPPAVVQTPKGPIPVAQAAQMLQEMDQQMQQMAQELTAAKAGIQKAQIDAQAATQKSETDAQARVRVAEIGAASAADVAELNGLVKLLIEKMQPPPALTADVNADLAADDQSQVT